jgi:hypothetical protein
MDMDPKSHDIVMQYGLYQNHCAMSANQAMHFQGQSCQDGQNSTSFHSLGGQLPQDPCLASQGLTTDTSQSTSPLWSIGHAYSSYPPVSEQAMAYCQPPQVVVPGQISTADDLAMSLRYSSYDSPEHAIDGFDHVQSSFDSMDSGYSHWEQMTPPSQDLDDSDEERSIRIKGEYFKTEPMPSPTPAGSSHDRAYGHSKVGPERHRKRPGKRGKSSVPRRKLDLHRVEVTYEGQWDVDEHGIPVKPIVGRTSKSKGYVCDFFDKETGRRCNQSFERSEHLKRHHSKHAPEHERKYPCPLSGCDRRIARSDNAGDHFKTHLKGPRKGQRNKFFHWNQLRTILKIEYEEKEANKMITKIEKWIREKSDGAAQREFLDYPDEY